MPTFYQLSRESYTHFKVSLLKCVTSGAWLYCSGAQRPLTVGVMYFQIAQEEEFLMLNPSQLIKLIHRDELNVFDERDVYKAVLQWVMYDEKTRRPKLDCIMKSVRCELLPARYLKEELENQPLLRGHDPCREYLVRLLKGGSREEPQFAAERRAVCQELRDTRAELAC